MRLITEAGKRLLGLSKTVGKGIGGNFKKAYSDEHVGTLALNFAPDLIFGAMYGAQIFDLNLYLKDLRYKPIF